MSPRARRVAGSPKGPSDANGGDHLNAHASSRFLRATDSPDPHAGGARHAGGYHRAVIPLSLIAIGLFALAAGWLGMHRLGPRARIGRILAATPTIEMGRALALAAAGSRRYVAVGGRVDAEEPWEDDNGRPLVFQRSRLELRAEGGWTTFEENRHAVPFELAGAMDRILVDGEQLDEGLVVVTRESEGTAADVADRLPAGTPPETPVRLRVEFLSAVDHALVLGVPVMDGDAAVMRPGLGRPLIVTTLEPAEAMRLLASGRQGATRAISVLLVAGLVAIVLGAIWAAVDALS